MANFEKAFASETLDLFVLLYFAIFLVLFHNLLSKDANSKKSISVKDFYKHCSTHQTFGLQLA